MFFSLRTITFIVFVVYCILTCYTGYILLKNSNNKENEYIYRKFSVPDDGEDWNPWGEEFEREHSYQSFTAQNIPNDVWPNKSMNFQKPFLKLKYEEANQHFESYNVEIWGKAAIGLYLWEHIIGGKLEAKMNGLWSYGFKRIENFKFKFRTGPGVIPAKAPSDVQNLVLVLNGRSGDKVAFARAWLDSLPRFRQLRSVLLVVLGDEQCRNDWIVPYTTRAGGLVNATFLVYDSPLVDNVHFYQWPLGVATYRGFPKVDPTSAELENARPYLCNFLGSVYAHSSREKMMAVIQAHNLTRFCFVKARHEWQPHETKSSLGVYLQSLRSSDLTLNPAGMNTECYRIYEAMAFGSVPVVEDVTTQGACARDRGTAPLRLLKAMGAPLLLVNDWAQLPAILAREQRLTLEEKIARRRRVVRWYEDFRLRLRDNLLAVLRQSAHPADR